MNRGLTHEKTKSDSIEWYTPELIFTALGETFDLDPCSPGPQHSFVPANKHLTMVEDGLTTPWAPEDFVWMNPPYGAGVNQWLDKFIGHHHGIALLPSRTDARWFQNMITQECTLCFIKGRVSFISDRPSDKRVGQQRPGSGSVLMSLGERGRKAVRTCDLGFVVEPV